MKAIPKQELINLINACVTTEIVCENDIKNIFNRYGDDYYKDYGDAPYELCKKNQYREAILNCIKENKRDCVICEWSKDGHCAGTEVCHLCMFESQYKPKEVADNLDYIPLE